MALDHRVRTRTPGGKPDPFDATGSVALTGA
ncbi:hypothetical protein ATL41_0480 [Flavimobilis soli]|uniref:Uncharacterized protein n=1 Tax=Flavimobilis soli TaxID=442709 RepID=A0A2A9EAE2_9MICO|nr:hypothetical protein ATL41_0480 [Flavimobilis soli]